MNKKYLSWFLFYSIFLKVLINICFFLKVCCILITLVSFSLKWAVWFVSVGLQPPTAATGQDHERIWDWPRGQWWLRRCCWRGEGQRRRRRRNRTLQRTTTAVQWSITWLLPWEGREPADALHQECYFSHSTTWWGNELEIILSFNCDYLFTSLVFHPHTHRPWTWRWWLVLQILQSTSSQGFSSLFPRRRSFDRRTHTSLSGSIWRWPPLQSFGSGTLWYDLCVWTHQ